MVETIKDDAIGLYADFDNRERLRSLTASRRSAKTLPAIDFAAYSESRDLAARRAVARQLRDACTDTGFFYLVNHGISASELDVAHDWGHLFFELPREGPALTGGGRWPNEELLPGFKAFSEAHILKRIAVVHRLCRALALSLDLREDYFDESHRFVTTAYVYNYYPALDPGTVGRTQWGISPHTDYGSFTLLSQDALGGLEIRDASGAWFEVPPLRGAFVVNIADLFARWTNGLYVSSLHRASNFNLGGRARISLSLFVIPHPKTEVACLPTCQGPGNPAKYEPVEAGPYVRMLLEQSYRTGRPGVMQKTAEERFKTL
ncbi:MAG TPA: 2OG-Fe(II) oxygenase family protein [Stellaceae bacterium]|jgi:isopenicillin N synthase-like dioxygenase